MISEGLEVELDTDNTSLRRWVSGSRGRMHHVSREREMNWWVFYFYFFNLVNFFGRVRKY